MGCLHEGWAFYASQGVKVGDYYFDSLLSDIESLVIYAGIHKKQFGFYRMLPKGFHMQFITITSVVLFLLWQCFLCGEVPYG